MDKRTLKIYMKSGNVISIKNISKYKIEFKGPKITNFEWTIDGGKELLKWIDITQIESIVEGVY